MNVAEIDWLINWLERKLPNSVESAWEFDMNSFVRKDTECGTACCMAGAIWLKYSSGNFIPEWASDFIRKGEAVLGITETQALQLFSPNYCELGFSREEWLEQTESYLEAVTPEWAVATLRYLKKYGKVDWVAAKGTIACPAN